MGYFKRNVDRARAREETRRLHEQFAGDEEWSPWDGKPLQKTTKLWYLRFSIAERHPWSRRRRGVFSAAYRLLEQEPDPETKAALNDILDWFTDELPAPDIDDDAAIFLFRSDDAECLPRIWDLVWILREHGMHVELQRVGDPGRVLYEDRYQIAAVPWPRSRSL